MKSIVFLTGSERRDDFARQAIALCDDIEILRSFCEKRQINQSRHDIPET